MSDEPQQPRRRFLKLTSGALCGGIVVAVGGPVVISFLAPRNLRTVTGGGDPMDYGKVDALPDGVPHQRDVVAQTHDAWARSDAHVIGSIWLLRESGHVAAYSAVCPHLGCSVGYDTKQHVFACPCHASTFAKGTGAPLGGPAPRGLDSLPLEIKDGTIRVTFKRFVLGIKQRREV